MDTKRVQMTTIEKTRENIIRIAKEHRMSEAVFVSEIKKAKCNGSFKPENWERYLKVITTWEMLNPVVPPKPTCPICGEIMGVDRELAGLYRRSPMTGQRCSNRHHFFMLLEASRIAETKGITFEGAVEVVKIQKELFYDADSRVACISERV